MTSEPQTPPDRTIANAMNVLLLIEHGLSEWMATRVIDQWNAKCVELKEAKAQRCSDVQDTYLVGGPNDLKAMSGSVESDRVIQLHFRRKATDEDRKWLLDAINAKLLDDRETPQRCSDEPASAWQPIETAPKDQEVEVRGIWKLRGDGVEFTHWRPSRLSRPHHQEGGK